MEIEPLSVDLPYPSLDGITKDIKSANIISAQYATLDSELNAILQYTYHHFYFEKLGMESDAILMERISLTEMRHFEILGKTILALGVDPIYVANPPFPRNFYNTSRVSYVKTPEQMLLVNIEGESEAIKIYKNMIDKLDNEKVSAIIQRIVLDEELHLAELEKAYKELVEK